jgi:hypothetical protein
MSYRPICDTWILARSKTNYYGAYPAGFLHRARALLGVGPRGSVLHVCAGKVRDYPFRGLGALDYTLDLDPACQPDFLQDARKPFPLRPGGDTAPEGGLWDAVLIDRPYTPDDAAHYVPGVDALPTINELVRNALAVLPPGGRVGTLDYLWPHPGNQATEVAVVAVGTGRNGRARWFVVFEKPLA